MTVNEKISELLDWQGMTQQELADRIGIPRANISTYVTGRSAVSVEMAYKIANGLGVTPWTLLNCDPLPVDPLELSKEEQQTMVDLRSLTIPQIQIVRVVIDEMKRQNKIKSKG